MTIEIPENFIKSLKSHYNNHSIDNHQVTAALQLLFHPDTIFNNDATRKKIYNGLAFLYHPDKNKEQDAAAFFKLLSVIKTDEGFKMLASIRSRLNPAVLPPRNPAPLPPQAAKYYYPPSKKNDMWADFNKKDQEDREKAKKEYLEKLRRQQAAAQAANQNPQYNEYGKAEFFRQARQENNKQPNQHQNDMGANFNKKDQEDREKAKKEYLEKLRRQQAAAQAAQAAQAANQNHKYDQYGKAAFFRQARQENNQQPDQYQNDYINILSKLDKIIHSMQNNFTQMKQSNDANIQNTLYNNICFSYYNAIRDIQSLSQTFINNYPELQKRRAIIEATRLQAYQERLSKKRQAQQPPRQEELPRQQPPRQEELPRQQQPQEPRTKQLLTSEQIALAKVYFAKNPTQTKLSRKTRILDNNGNPVLLPHSIMKSADQKLYALYRGKQAYRNPENKQGFLGQGSFGRVKLAQCLDDGKIVAAKMALINKYQTVDDINKEKAMQEAAGQYLGSTRTNFKYQNKHYIFSEFIEGESLTNIFFMPNTKYLIPKKNISSNDKKGNLEIILATLQATQELHKKGIIHGDLSFNNILYNPETKKATIIDFGRAVKSNQDLIQDPLIRLPYAIPFNPNHYAPPELNGARANYRSDIYSIGKWINWYADATRDPFLQELSRGMLNPDPTKRVNAQMCIDKINTALYNQQYNQTRRPW